MAKFDIKKLKSASIDIKKDIENIEKNRAKPESPVVPEVAELKAEEFTEPVAQKSETVDPVKAEKKTVRPVKRTPSQNAPRAKAEKAEKITASKNPENTSLKVVSITLPVEVKNYLKIAPKLNGITITSFLHDLIAKDRASYKKRGVDVAKTPDFSTLPDVKARGKGESPVIISIKMSPDNISWVKMAAIYNGLNVSQYMEGLIRKAM